MTIPFLYKNPFNRTWVGRAPFYSRGGGGAPCKLESFCCSFAPFSLGPLPEYLSSAKKVRGLQPAVVCLRSGYSITLSKHFICNASRMGNHFDNL